MITFKTAVISTVAGAVIAATVLNAAPANAVPTPGTPGLNCTPEVPYPPYGAICVGYANWCFTSLCSKWDLPTQQAQPTFRWRP